MSMKPFCLSALLALGLSPRPALAAADAPAAASPSAEALPQATAVAPTAPVAARPSSPSAQAPSSPAPVSAVAEPSAPATPMALSATSATPALDTDLSGTADDDGDSLEAEEVGEDGIVVDKTQTPDLSSLDSETLAAMAAGVDRDTTDLYFDPTAKQAIPEAAPGAWHISVDPLYYELAKRTLNDTKDKAARQSFALALFKDSDRAKEAKDQAYDDKLADTVIAQLESGRERARMDLQALAEKGNRKARLYLGMDKPAATRADADGNTASAQADTSTAATVAPTETAPQPVSGVASDDSTKK